MSGAFESINADRIAADRLGFDSVPNRGAFVNDLDAGCMKAGYETLRIVSGCFDNLDVRFNDGLRVFLSFTPNG